MYVKLLRKRFARLHEGAFHMLHASFLGEDQVLWRNLKREL
jgi:hypothetical protein